MPTSTEPLVWLITGASRGIGLALARHVLAHNHILIATSRSPTSTPALVHEITTHPSRRGHWLALDVTSPSLESVVQHAEALHGRIDVLVNNAGYAVLGAVEEVPVEMVREQLETNFVGPVRLMGAVLPEMRRRGSGVVVNVGSASGVVAVAGNGVYSASKFALEAVGEAMGREVEGFGVRVVSVVLGAFRTGFGREGAKVVEPEVGGGYEEVVGRRLAFVGGLAETARGYPVRAAERIWEIAVGEEGVRMRGNGKRCTRFVLGEDSWEAGWRKIEELRETWEVQREYAKGTAFEA